MDLPHTGRGLCAVFILRKELVEWDVLPSIRGGANDIKVSVLTIQRVYDELEQEEFVLPVQYKLGYKKTKFAFVVIIMASPFILPYLLKTNQGFYIHSLNSISPVIICIAAVLTGLMLLTVSVIISIKIYNKTDLA